VSPSEEIAASRGNAPSGVNAASVATAQVVVTKAAAAVVAAGEETRAKVFLVVQLAV
jgi:hypothetical protein